MDSAILLAVVMCIRALPDDLVPEIVYAKDSVHYAFEVVARGRVAVEVDAASGCEDPVHFGEAWSHEGEVCTHRSFTTGDSVLEY